MMTDEERRDHYQQWARHEQQAALQRHLDQCPLPLDDQPRTVEEMISGLADQIADLRILIAELREDMRGNPHVAEFPRNALRHSR